MIIPEPKFFEDLVVVVSNFTIELDILSKSISDLLDFFTNSPLEKIKSN